MGEEGAGGEVVGVADEPELGEEEGELVLLVFQWNRQSQPNRPLPQAQTLPEEACDLVGAARLVVVAVVSPVWEF